MTAPHDDEVIRHDTLEVDHSIGATMSVSATVSDLDAHDDLIPFCPQCGADLADPGRLGWCLRCGYCRYLENAEPVEPIKIPIDPELRASLELLIELSRVLRKKLKTNPALQAQVDTLDGLVRLIKRKASSGQDVSNYGDLLQAFSKKFTKGQEDVDVGGCDELFANAEQRYKAEMAASHAAGRQLMARLNLPIPGLERVPEWLAVLVCGLFICAVGSFMAQMNLRTTEHIRILWSIGEMVAGALVMGVAQVRAFLDIVPRGLRLRKCLMIVSFELWRAVWLRLPVTSWPIWLLGWGAGLAVSGGLTLLAVAMGF